MNHPTRSARWRVLPLALAAAGILGSMACAIPVTVYTRNAHDFAATELYRPRAEQGQAVAQYQLALCYRAGIAGVKRDAAESWRWLQAAARQGHEQARTDEADAWLFGDFGQAQDVPRGLAAWRALAEQGSVNAPFHFATRLADARNAWADPREAARWFEAAARRNHRSAGYKLAQLLEAGAPGWAAEPVEAAAWYRWSRAMRQSERLEASLSPAQRQQAQQRWQTLEREVAP